MCSKLDAHYGDILKDLRNEATLLKNAMDRAIVDHKVLNKTLYSLRIPWVSGISINEALGSVNFNTNTFDKTEYDGMFDSYHYDVGHGWALFLPK